MGDMATAPAYVTHRIDIDEYHRMAAAGVFDPDLRIELIDGELIQRVAPMYPPHAGGVSNLASSFVIAFDGLADVRNQVALVAFDSAQNFRRHPTPRDIFSLVEVCDSTRDVDQRRKVPLYAREGVTEVWLVDIIDFCVRTYNDPSDGEYRTVRRYERGERVSSRAFPAIDFAVTEMLPPRE